MHFKFILGKNICVLIFHLLGWLFTKNWFFPNNISRYGQLKFENISKTLPFYSFIFFKRTHGNSIQANYIYSTKITNEWFVGDIIRLFADYEMLILEI